MSELAAPEFEQAVVRQLFPGSSLQASGPRLESIGVDGFGALAGLEIGDLQDGLTILLGPNEAGKSTLFDFISGVLFGFPSRRADSRYHAPVRGGRHGGRLGLVDRAGGSWLLERYLQPKKSFSIRRPDGSAGDEAEVRQLLGGATEELFGAVFAINLDDLRQLDGMSSAEVREVLFSSSVLGRRRSTARALDELDKACESLVRPRQGGSANALADLLRQERAGLEAARSRAGSFATLEAARAELASQAADLGEAYERQRRRLGELELLKASWEVTSQQRRIAEELALLPPLSPLDHLLLERAERLEALHGQLSGHLERFESYEKDREKRDGLARSVAEKAAELGGDRALALVGSDGFEVGELREELDRRRSRLGHIEGRLATLEQAVAAEREALSSVSPAEEETPPVDLSQLNGRLELLRRLQGWQVEKENVAGQLEQKELRARSAGLAGGGLPRPAAGVLALLAAVLLAVGGALFAHHQLGYGLVILVVALALLTAVLLGRRRPTAAPGRTLLAEAEELQARYEEASVEVARLAEEGGFSLPLSPLSLQEAISETERRREQRRAVEDREARAAAAARRLEGAESDLAAAGRELVLESAGLEALADRVASPGAEPDELSWRLDRLATLQDRHLALQRVEAELERTGRAISQFEQQLLALAAELGQEPPAGGPGGHLHPEDATALVLSLVEQAARSSQRGEERRRLEATLREGEGQLERLLGHGERAEELRAELASGRVLDWAAEATEVESSLAGLRKDRDDLLREEEGLSRQLQEILASSDVARLEQRCLEIEQELSEALEQYLVTSGARLLLQETLRRYEKERQPAVLALASEHFARVTEDRYVRLGVRTAPDGTKPAVEVFTAEGAALDAASLSRGTTEQLYLALRLGLAESFAERYLPLPLVLDDVLVNCDPERRQLLARELARVAEHHQVLFLTCHPDVADLLERTSPRSRVVSLPRL